MGIGRAFAYGGFYEKRNTSNPDVPYEIHNTFEEYKSKNGSTINHFYEKLLLLKDKMNTKTGKEKAEKRLEFMLSFLDEFYSEWNGKNLVFYKFLEMTEKTGYSCKNKLIILNNPKTID